MGTTGYLVLGAVVVVAAVGRLDLRLRAALASVRSRDADRRARDDRAIRAVRRRLEAGPVPVEVRGERGLRGHRLVLDTGDSVLRLHLYGGSDLTGRRPPAKGGDQAMAADAGVFLTRIGEDPARGWQVELAGLAGTSTYEGWLLEQRGAAAERGTEADRRSSPPSEWSDAEPRSSRARRRGP